MRLPLLALLLVLAPAVAAQTAVDSTLQPFAFLVGRWAGPAWYASPSGERQALYQTESVRPLLDGTVLLIEGEGREGGPDGAVVFQALGVLSYDRETGRPYLDAFNDGRRIRTEVTPVEDGGGFDWGFEAGGRTIRYAMRLDDGRWHETGHVLLGNGQEVPFVELTLDRVEE